MDLDGDLERDGDLDLDAPFLALALPAGFLAVLAPFLAGDWDLAGDLDLDGDLDLAGEAERERDGDLDAPFLPLALLGAFFGDLAVFFAGDLDLDGDLDLVVAFLPLFSLSSAIAPLSSSV